MKIAFNPLVSIVIPVYNGSNYLAQAIESALAQTYEPVEVLVVNDGSQDGGKTRDIALSYGGRLRYFEKENGGVATALNLGIEKMQGDYLAWLSHDDEFLPDKLADQIAYLQGVNDRENTIQFANFIVHDLLSGNRYQPNYLDEKAMNGDAFDSWLLTLFTSPLHGCTSLLPKSCFRKIGLFDSRQRTTQDYDFFVRLLRGGYRFCYRDKPLILTRHHSEQDTRRIPDVHHKDVYLYFMNTIDVFAEEFKSFSFEKVKPFLDILESRNQQDARRKLQELWSSANPAPLPANEVVVPAISKTKNIVNKNSWTKIILRRIIPAPLRAVLRNAVTRAGISLHS